MVDQAGQDVPASGSRVGLGERVGESAALADADLGDEHRMNGTILERRGLLADGAARDLVLERDGVAENAGDQGGVGKDHRGDRPLGQDLVEGRPRLAAPGGLACRRPDEAHTDGVVLGADLSVHIEDACRIDRRAAVPPGSQTATAASRAPCAGPAARASPSAPPSPC